MRILKNSPRSSHMALIGVIEPSHLLTLYQLQVYAHFSGVWALQVTTLLASVVVLTTLYPKSLGKKSGLIG